MNNDVETTSPPAPTAAGDNGKTSEQVVTADASEAQVAADADAIEEANTHEGVTPDPESQENATPDADAESATDDVVDAGSDATTHDATSADEGQVVEDSSDQPTAAKSRRSSSSSKADLEREGEVAADFLETLMDIADLDGDLEVDVDGDRAAVSIVDSEEGSVPRRLVGTRADVLEALQELTRLAVQAETGERSRLMLDVGGYRANRRTELVDSAAVVIAAVKGGEPRREMEPMSAFERKVVHDEVLRAGLRSESEGEEPRRFVVVLPS